MIRLALAAVAAIAPGAAFAGAETVLTEQEFGPATIQHHLPGGAPVSLVGLVFMSSGEFVLETDVDGVSNPVYDGFTQVATNPVYGASGETSLLAQIASITIGWDGLTHHTTGSGVVHRDLRAERITIETDFGVYESASESVIFRATAPFGYFDDGPVTWSTNQAIVLHQTGVGSSGDFLRLQGFSFTDTLVPAPGAGMLLGLGGLAAARRRR